MSKCALILVVMKQLKIVCRQPSEYYGAQRHSAAPNHLRACEGMQACILLEGCASIVPGQCF